MSKNKLKSLGIKKEQPEHLKKAVQAGAGKNTRFKPGEVHNPAGSKLQIIKPRAQAKVVKTVGEILRELVATPMSEQLAAATGISAEGTNLLDAVCIGLLRAGMAGDVNAFKTIAGHLQTSGAPLNPDFPLAVGPHPSLRIVVVNTAEEVKELAAERQAWEAERRQRETQEANSQSSSQE